MSKNDAGAPVEHGHAKKWWERLADASAENRKRTFGMILAAVGAILVVILAYNLYSKSQESRRNETADLIREGQVLLPDVGNPFAPKFPDVGGASAWYATQAMEATAPITGRDGRDLAISHVAPFQDREKTSEYHDKIVSVIGKFSDSESDVADSDQAWLFYHVWQQLEFAAALTSFDVEERLAHLDRQSAHLATIKDRFGQHPTFQSTPDVRHPDKTLIDLWREAGEQERTFWQGKRIPGPPQADATLTATLEFDNGTKVELEFFSRVAPKAVENFVRLARSGFYDGTAIHAIDEVAGTLTGGDALSKIAPDRPRIWHKGDVGYLLPLEANPLLKVAEGTVTLEQSRHGSHFVIHTATPETPNQFITVFARIKSGLEELKKYLDEAETIDDAQAENPDLPKKPLRLTKVVIEGSVEHPSDDSWVPELKMPEPPEKTDEEKRVEKEAAAGEDKGVEEADKPDSESPAKETEKSDDG